MMHDTVIYAGRLSPKDRQGAIDHKVKGWEMLSGAQQWTMISKRLLILMNLMNEQS